MNILEQIIRHKRLEVHQRRMASPIQELQGSRFFNRPVLSLREALNRQGSTGIIAEFKRRSPSKGAINETADVVDVTSAYAEHGAAALSVLTDGHFFGGSNDDLIAARVNTIPILRKDFIVDEYQVVEARAIGADVILLIAACLSPEEVQRIGSFAVSLGLEVLLEIHDASELGHITEAVQLVGVNNRDLKTFTVDIQRSIDLSRRIPSGKLTIAESGINSPGTIKELSAAGFSGFLIGEHFMKEENPAIAFASFVNRLKKLSPPEVSDAGHL